MSCWAQIRRPIVYEVLFDRLQNNIQEVSRDLGGQPPQGIGLLSTIAYAPKFERRTSAKQAPTCSEGQ